MRDFAKVAPQFWTGPTGKEIRRLGRDCQVVSMYLITCPSSSALGLYYLPIPTLSHETGIPAQGALKALQRLSEAGFCRYDAAAEWVFVPKMARFQIGARLEPKDNRVKWIRRELEAIAKSPFLNDFLKLYRDDFHLQDVGPSEAPSEAPRSQETETKKETEKEKKNSRSQARPKKPDFEVWFEEQFVPAYPEHRQVQHKNALSELRKLKPGAEEQGRILARLDRWKQSADWRRDSGAYVPGMGKFFAEGLFKREPPSLGTNGATSSSPPRIEEFDQRDAEAAAGRAR